MYGFCIFLGIICATLVGERLCKRRGLDPQIFWRMVFFGLVFGVLGARLYHVLHRLDYFMASPWEVLAIWRGGLGIWGAIFGGLAGLFLSTRSFVKIIVSKITFAKTPPLTTLIGKDFLTYLDIFAVCAPLAQAVGRWGNYFNKELFGFPTNLPWGIYIPSELRPEVFKYFDRFHPLFFYESILNLALFVFLYNVFSRQNYAGKKISHGFIVLLYLMGYSIIRLSLEFLRPEPWKVLNFPVAGLISIVLLSMILLWILKNQRRLWICKL